MGRLTIKVIGYIFLRFAVFFGIAYIIYRDVKLVKWSDLKNSEDWFMFLWLFFVPSAIEAIVLTFPFTYGLYKITNRINKLGIYTLFLGLFVIEFMIYKGIIGIQYPFLKVGVSITLFLLLFLKRLLK